jgi:hypothetical protein
MRHSRIGLPLALLCVLSASALAACGGSDGPPVPDQAPADPGASVDSRYQIVAPAAYLLVGDALTPATPSFTMKVVPPAGVRAVYYWLDGAGPTAFTGSGGVFELTVDATAIAPGAHRILLSADDEPTAFAGYDLAKGHALYVVTSTDWDDPDNGDDRLLLQEQLHAAHPALKLTHLVGPYTFTDPTVSEERRTELADWVKMMRDTYGDEIGTHIHPYCSFVTAAGVTCKTTPSTVYPAGDDTGYTVRLGAYTREEWNTMFAKVDELWAARGFGKPTSFRAGGWTLEISTAQALADSGYVADGSPNNWARMEEWDTPQYELYPWNMAQWSSIDDTSQPYYPTDQNLLGSSPGTIVPLLLLPDNGILVDYVTGEEMIEIFGKNWPGGPLAEPRALNIGYHPPNFSQFYWDRLDMAMDHFDRFLAQAGAGPVVYANMSDMAKVWPVP